MPEGGNHIGVTGNNFTGPFKNVKPTLLGIYRKAKSRIIRNINTERWEKLLTGIGTRTGVVTAPACVLNSPADFEKFQPGSILIAVTTTPAWTPLFASASAIVTDIGGPLSRSSIVAREYGISLSWQHTTPREPYKTDK